MAKATRRVTTLAAVGLAVSCFFGSSHAQERETAFPAFGDPQVRPLRPDLSSLPRLRFLTTIDFPPFSSLDSRGSLSGFNVDLAREICRELGIAAKCDIQALPWNTLQAALEKGEGDAVLAGISVSEQSRAAYAFSQPYLRFPARFVTAKGDKAEEPLWRALAGGPVGTVAGSAHEKFLRDHFEGVGIKPYPGIDPMLRDLAAGRIRAAFGDGMRLSFWLGGESGACCRFAGGSFWAPGYFGSGLTIATRPGDRLLQEAMNFALHEIAAKKGFTELALRWFPVGFF